MPNDPTRSSPDELGFLDDFGSSERYGRQPRQYSPVEDLDEQAEEPAYGVFDLFSDIGDAVSDVAEIGSGIGESVGEYVGGLFDDWGDSAESLSDDGATRSEFPDLWSGIGDAVSDVAEIGSNIGESVGESVGELFDGWGEADGDSSPDDSSGWFDRIVDGAKEVAEDVVDVAQDTADVIAEFFGLQSSDEAARNPYASLGADFVSFGGETEVDAVQSTLGLTRDEARDVVRLKELFQLTIDEAREVISSRDELLRLNPRLGTLSEADRYAALIQIGRRKLSRTRAEWWAHEQMFPELAAIESQTAERTRPKVDEPDDAGFEWWPKDEHRSPDGGADTEPARQAEAPRPRADERLGHFRDNRALSDIMTCPIPTEHEREENGLGDLSRTVVPADDIQRMRDELHATHHRAVTAVTTAAERIYQPVLILEEFRKRTASWPKEQAEFLRETRGAYQRARRAPRPYGGRAAPAWNQKRFTDLSEVMHADTYAIGINRARATYRLGEREWYAKAWEYKPMAERAARMNAVLEQLRNTRVVERRQLATRLAEELADLEGLRDDIARLHIAGPQSRRGGADALTVWRRVCTLKLKILNARALSRTAEAAETALIVYEQHLNQKDGTTVFGMGAGWLLGRQTAPEQMARALTGTAVSTRRNVLIDRFPGNDGYVQRLWRGAEEDQWEAWRKIKDSLSIESGLQLRYSFADWLTGVAEDLLTDIATAGVLKGLSAGYRLTKSAVKARRAARSISAEGADIYSTARRVERANGLRGTRRRVSSADVGARGSRGMPSRLDLDGADSQVLPYRADTPWRYESPGEIDLLTGKPGSKGTVLADGSMIVVKPGLSAVDEAETIRHEITHRLLMPKGKSFSARGRRAASSWFYDKSRVMQRMEEFIAEAYATRDLGKGWTQMKNYRSAFGLGDLALAGILGGTATVTAEGVMYVSAKASEGSE